MNEWAWLGSNMTLPSISTLAELACEVHREAGDILLRKADHADAYRQLPISPGHSSFAIVCFKSESGVWMGCRPNTLLFGASLAVLSYNLASRFLSVLYSKFFGLPCTAFYDDFSGVARGDLGSLPLGCFKLLNEAVGLVLKEKKCVFSKIVQYLGVEISVASLPPVISLPEDKRVKYFEQV